MNEDREHPMTGERVAGMRERLAPVAEYAPYKVYVDRVIQASNHPEIRPFVLASNVTPGAAEFIANAPGDLAYLLAEVAALRGRLAAVEAEVAPYDDGCPGNDECCAETLALGIRAALASEEDA